ncbi:unnamed protein product [Chrysodeixis includens]|uniref:Uncharacterized protein n=1 Tax=Chrysodeixis includens TaxID=689277 RepID=A0A9N8KX41_CHRIL|nr:unnamed protein product [Chrysodeixis includens]
MPHPQVIMVGISVYKRALCIYSLKIKAFEYITLKKVFFYKLQIYIFCILYQTSIRLRLYKLKRFFRYKMGILKYDTEGATSIWLTNLHVKLHASAARWRQ